MEPNKSHLTRRSFLVASAAAGVALATPGIAAVSNANEKIRVGFIGVGNRGSQLLRGFLDQKDCQVVALCDVYEPYLMRDRNAIDSRIFASIGDGLVPKMGEAFDGPIARHHDFRRLLEQKDVDAVVVATPDHWHAVQTIMAFDAGKDVYVEKPLTATISEGRKMVQAQERTKRVAQVGLHRRSSRLYAHLHELIRDGHVGKVTVARAYRVSSMFPDGIGKMPDSPPPTGLDWDMWLGPRASRPYRFNLAPYKFRWWSDYSSQMGNWGVHYCDAIRWMLDEQAPSAISAHGGKFAIDDDRTIPDTLDVTFEFASGRVLHFGQYEACDSSPLPGAELELNGTKASIYPAAEAHGAKIVPARKGQFQQSRPSIPGEEIAVMDGDLTHQHIRNFLDCIRSRARCNCDLETGHRSTTFAHLANLALRTRARLEWDAQEERFTNNEAANQLLEYEYRAPWKLG